MLKFHALLFPSPRSPIIKRQIEIRGITWEVLETSQAELHRGWPQSWEQTLDRLAELPRLHAEPDGSFTWSSDQGQLAGVLYDRAGQMCYAELFGNCSSETLDSFLTACGWPEEKFVFQLPEEGVTVEEHFFRQMTKL